MRFEIDTGRQIRIYNEIEARGEQIGDLPFASEDRGTPVADRRQPRRRLARRGLADRSLADGEPVVRAFEIDGIEVAEVELVVE